MEALLAALVLVNAATAILLFTLLVVYALPEKASARKFRGDRIDMDVARWELLTLNDDLMRSLRDRKGLLVAGVGHEQQEPREGYQSEDFAHRHILSNTADGA